tara:strand:+ start:387180 stop:387986 length:807 start_codon:yes stop_codon:yes gene_type:complete
MSEIRLPEIQRERICHLGQDTLWEDDAHDVEEAREYLLKKRRLPERILREYRFGYMPRRVRHDWSERIIMPLYDPYGELIVLTSRKFRATEQREYPHLHETFNKRFYFYGFDVAKKDIMQKGKAIVVEGQFDTARMRAAGFKMTIGILGSAFTFEHACILRRYCSEVYLLFDHDESGLKTLRRSMEMMDTQDITGTFGMDFIPVILPKQEDQKKIDPDAFLEERGAAEMRDVLAQAKLERKQFSYEDIDRRIEKYGISQAANGGSGSK